MPIHSTITHQYDLSAPLRVTPLRHQLIAGDRMADRFEVAVTRDGQPAALDGASVTGCFLREADGCTVLIPGQASGGTASLTLPEACYAVPGRFTLTLRATAGEERHAVAVFEGAVLRSQTEAIIDPGHHIPDLNELLEQVAQLEAEIASARGATASASAAAATANAAAGNADSAAALIRGITVTAHPVASGGAPTAEVSDAEGRLRVDFGLVRGERGEPGPVGSIDNLLVNGVAARDGRIDLTGADVPGARAVNMLDNSDFTHFVAQAGIGGSHGSQPYACDRWKLISGTVELVSGVGLKLNGTIEQVIARPIPNPHTVVIHTASGDATYAIEGNALRISAAGAVLLDAALYPGAIPGDVPYQPRGYVIELLTCLRYYYASAAVTQPVGLVSGQYRCYLRLPVPMRAAPTITMTPYGQYTELPVISDLHSGGAMLYKADYWALSGFTCAADL